MINLQNSTVRYLGPDPAPTMEIPKHEALRAIKLVQGHTLCFVRVVNGSVRLLSKLTLVQVEAVNSKISWEFRSASGEVLEGGLNWVRRGSFLLCLESPTRLLVRRDGIRWPFKVRCEDPNCRVMLLPEYEKRVGL